MDWGAVQGTIAILTLAACGIGQLWLSARRSGTVHQKLTDIEKKVAVFDAHSERSNTQRADHERRISDLESDVEPLKMTRDDFLELRGQSRAEHVAQNKVLEEIKGQLAGIGGRLDGLQRQITNVVMGSADTSEETPAYPIRRRGRR